MAKTYTKKVTTKTGTTISSTDDGRRQEILNGDLPTNVSDESQLANLPPECLASYTTGISLVVGGNEYGSSGSDMSLVGGGNEYGSSGSDTTDDINDDDSDEMIKIERPLRHVDDMGNEYFYSLKPMQYSVIFILIVELFERFAFYGIYYTQTLFLTGAYNEDWNAGFTSVKAASFVSMSTMVAYTTPFIGAFVSDSLFGDYKSLMVGLLVFYIPGVSLILLTTIPNLLGDEFNETLLTFGFLFLWPLGTGIVKSIVNVFGAKQYHPLLQSSFIESYYVSFYTVINVGALAGICIIPIVAQRSIFLAYLIPLCLLIIGGICFLSGTPRYIRTPPRQRRDNEQLFLCGGKDGRKPNPRKPKSTSLFDIFSICLLAVPFNVGYNQMPTTFIVQGSVMSKAFGFLDVASLNSLDAISVLVFGSITANCIYPYLLKRGIKIPTTYKFAIGSVLGSVALAWAIVVDKMIHSTFEQTGEQVNVLWQAPSYILIGFGEIFTVSTAYEVAFTAAPPDKKVLASATNIFCVGGLPNMICIALIHFCRRWFTNSHGNENIGHVEDYASAHVGKYFVVLLSIMMFGVFINVLPWVKEYVESIEERASDLAKTPSNTPTSILRRRNDEENSPLLVKITPRTKKHRQYLKYGSGPIYSRTSSMRAGTSFSRKDGPDKIKKIQYKAISKLYGKEPKIRKIKVATGVDGQPIKVGSFDM